MAKEPQQKTTRIGHPRRGEIYLVSFDPTVGYEIKKTRPALVLQNNVGNRYSPITIVAALSTKYGEPPYPTEVIVSAAESGLNQPSAVLLNQIRSIDRQRLIKRLSTLPPTTMRRVDQALQISLGLIEL